jgi:predicted RNA-binding Zn ribbon-like protein
MTGENPNKPRGPQPGGRAPAPGELGLVQSFLNTRWDFEDPLRADIFRSPEALASWIRSHGLVQGRPSLSQGDLDRTLTVREGLRALAFANNDQGLDRGAIDAMRQASRGAGTEIRIEPDGPRFVGNAAAGIDGAIGALFAITARAMIDGSWQRLKACPGRHCGWAFYDSSRNQSARWCSMKVCGDREKSRAYYQRKTAREPTTRKANPEEV